MANWDVNKHIFLHSDNAEEVLQEAINQIKNKASWDSRKKAFEDCTNYWKGRVQNIVISDSSESQKLEEIKKMFGA